MGPGALRLVLLIDGIKNKVMNYLNDQLSIQIFFLEIPLRFIDLLVDKTLFSSKKFL